MNPPRENVSKKENLNYLMVLPVGFFSLSDGTCACESAFSEHLQLLKEQIGEAYSCITIVAPEKKLSSYGSTKQYMSELSLEHDSIEFISAFPEDVSRKTFPLFYFFPVFFKLFKLVRRSTVVHAGPSDDVFKPFEIIGILLAVLMGKKSIFVVDIDHRKSVEMAFATGEVSRKSYYLQKYIYGPFMTLQIRFASRFCDLALLKSRSLAQAHLNPGRDNVKNFYDAAHSEEYILNDESLLEKQKAFVERDELRVCYFGRITAYKGIIDMLDSIKLAVDSGHKIHFSIIGIGDQLDEIIEYVAMLGLNEYIEIPGPLPYGPVLFSRLAQEDVLLAAPLLEDTPRNVFDAMAAGLLTIAYDTYYYEDLSESGAVYTVPWRDKKAFAEKICDMASHKTNYVDAISQGRSFAKANTQDIWLKRRADWLASSIG